MPLAFTKVIAMYSYSPLIPYQAVDRLLCSRVLDYVNLFSNQVSRVSTDLSVLVSDYTSKLDRKHAIIPYADYGPFYRTSL